MRREFTPFVGAECSISKEYLNDIFNCTYKYYYAGYEYDWKTCSLLRPQNAREISQFLES
jgi:hypothetical protein